MLMMLIDLVFGLSFLAVAATAQDTSGPGFGGPDAVENQIESDFGETWDDWKQGLKDDLGLVLSVDYTAVLLTANETFDDKNGAGGIARLFGTFDLFNVENGTLVYKFEHRHAYGSVSPFDFSLGQIGYVGLQEPAFNDTDFRTQNLYWRQRMNGGRSVLIAGILDVTDYLDAFALASPWLHFMNFAFSTGSAAIGLPNERSGEIVKVFVVRKNDSVTEQDIMDHCRKNLTGYKRPKIIEFRDELPKTNVGKILRRALRE